MQVCDKHANEHTPLKQEAILSVEKKGGAVHWTASQTFVSINITKHLYLSDYFQQKIKKIVTLGLKTQKLNVYFMCNSMEPFISVVRPNNQERLSPSSKQAVWGISRVIFTKIFK